ncbi:MAG: dTDP-4-dehydrorhamnose reductase [Cellvibrionaceae bacterium]
MSEKMKIALFGAAGQVGTDCAEALTQAGYVVISLTRNDVDFSQPDAVAQQVKSLKPDLVINACAYTAVDNAEKEKDLADLVNHQSVAAMAGSCAGLAIPLLHISTDYVFDGTATSPYQENDSVKPLGIYGETKLAGEKAIQDRMDQYIILRTSWVFGEQGNNFVKTMLRLGADRDQLSVVEDQVGRPSYVGDIVTAIESFVTAYENDQTLPWGIYHCSSEGETSWYDFAKAIFEKAFALGVLEKQPALSAIPSSQYPTPAPRPAYSVLATEKLEKFMGAPLPHWSKGLDTFINNMKSQ